MGTGCLALLGSIIFLGWCVTLFDSTPTPSSGTPSTPIAEPTVPVVQQASQVVSASSDTCVSVAGETARDRDRALTFCRQAVPADLGITGVIAMQSLLWVKVPRELADVMRSDILSTEQVVKSWMNAWKTLTGSQSVTVYVEWQDIEIAIGETSVFSGDQVTIR